MKINNLLDLGEVKQTINIAIMITIIINKIYIKIHILDDWMYEQNIFLLIRDENKINIIYKNPNFAFLSV